MARDERDGSNPAELSSADDSVSINPLQGEAFALLREQHQALQRRIQQSKELAKSADVGEARSKESATEAADKTKAGAPDQVVDRETRPSGDSKLTVQESSGRTLYTRWSETGIITGDLPTGAAVSLKANGTVSVEFPGGVLASRLPDGVTFIEYPDKNRNSVKTIIDPEGSRFTAMPDGSSILVDKDGSISTCYPDGTSIRERPGFPPQMELPGGRVITLDGEHAFERNWGQFALLDGQSRYERLLKALTNISEAIAKISSQGAVLSDEQLRRLTGDIRQEADNIAVILPAESPIVPSDELRKLFERVNQESGDSKASDRLFKGAAELQFIRDLIEDPEQCGYVVGRDKAGKPTAVIDADGKKVELERDDVSGDVTRIKMPDGTSVAVYGKEFSIEPGRADDLTEAKPAERSSESGLQVIERPPVSENVTYSSDGAWRTETHTVSDNTRAGEPHALATIEKSVNTATGETLVKSDVDVNGIPCKQEIRFDADGKAASFTRQVGSDEYRFEIEKSTGRITGVSVNGKLIADKDQIDNLVKSGEASVDLVKTQNNIRNAVDAASQTFLDHNASYQTRQEALLQLKTLIESKNGDSKAGQRDTIKTYDGINGGLALLAASGFELKGESVQESLKARKFESDPAKLKVLAENTAKALENLEIIAKGPPANDQAKNCLMHFQTQQSSLLSQRPSAWLKLYPI